MKPELADLLRATPPHATLAIDDIQWKLYVFGVSRVGPDLFVQIAVMGPRTRTATVRARGPIGNPMTARRVLAVVRDWLISGDRQEPAFLELGDRSEIAS
jgi:hypothetical protein